MTGAANPEGDGVPGDLLLDTGMLEDMTAQIASRKRSRSRESRSQPATVPRCDDPPASVPPCQHGDTAFAEDGGGHAPSAAASHEAIELGKSRRDTAAMVVMMHQAHLTAQQSERDREEQASELETLREQNSDFQQRLTSAEVRNTVHLAAQQAVEAMLEATANLHAARVASMSHRITSLRQVVDAQRGEVCVDELSH